jgi:hypothetical protein
MGEEILRETGNNFSAEDLIADFIVKKLGFFRCLDSKKVVGAFFDLFHEGCFLLLALFSIKFRRQLSMPVIIARNKKQRKFFPKHLNRDKRGNNV